MSSATSRSSSVSQAYPFFQDAVRIFVQHRGGSGPGGGDAGDSSSGSDPNSSTSTSSGPTLTPSSSRRFSVDPQLTSFDILRNLIGRAFDMKGDFAISYRAFDDYGGETYLPMVSDWDLSAAFHSASDPDLQLIVEPKKGGTEIPGENTENENEDTDAPWDLIRSADVININDASRSPLSDRLLKMKYQQQQQGQNNGTIPRIPTAGSVVGNGSAHPHSRSHTNAHAQAHTGAAKELMGGSGSGSSMVLTAMSQLGGAVNQYPLELNTKINTAGLFNTMEKWVQKAKTFVEDLSVVTSRPPLSDVEFRHYLDSGGVLCRPRELRYACYHGGVEPGLRKVVWKHLLNIYPDGLSGNARMDYVRSKCKEYYELRDDWANAVKAGRVNEDIQCVSNMVRKDVLRTDRHLEFFAGQEDNDNQNISILFNILTTYALNHPSVGYCQGMSDLASPLLVTMGDEAQAYVCFCALMDRLKPNFSCDGIAMSLKFAHLSEALAFYDEVFWGYLKSVGADDLLFCYRWLLLEMKREFAFEDALRMMEVLWASLPYKPQDVPLFEVRFISSVAQTIPIPVPPLTVSYSKVCELRRSSSSSGSGCGSGSNEIRNRRFSRKPKVSPLSLDESSCITLSPSSSIRRTHTKPFYSLDESIEVTPTTDLNMAMTMTSVLGSSPFEILAMPPPPLPLTSLKPRLVKNLKEFWTIGKPISSKDKKDKSHHHHHSSSGTGTGTGAGSSLAGSDDSGGESTSTGFSPTSSKSSTISNFDSIQNLRDVDVDVDVDMMNGADGDGDCDAPVFDELDHVDAQQKPKNLTRSRASANSSATATATAAALSQLPLHLPLHHNLFLTPQDLHHDHDHDHQMKNHNHLLHHQLRLPDDGEMAERATLDSENDSGHCLGDSVEIFENSLQLQMDAQLALNLALPPPPVSPPNSTSADSQEGEGSQSGIQVDVMDSESGKGRAKMPHPEALGGGNPFLMFLCVTLLLQHREHILKNQLDYNETAMYFDKMIRKHNVGRVLAQARLLYSEYLKHNVARA